MTYVLRLFLFICRLLSLAANLFSLSWASSFLPPAKTGIGGGNMMEMVLALFVLTEV